MAIYLDHASTTPLDPAIADLIASSSRQGWANPASQHSAGRQAKAALEDSKDRIKAACLGESSTSYQQWQAWQLVITSGGTEANNLALHGLVAAPAQIFVGATEHPSIVAPAKQSPSLAPRAMFIPVDGSTLAPNIDVLDTQLDAYLRSPTVAAGPALVSVMMGNNETGIVPDLAELSKVCRKHGAILHSDAVQAIGKCDLSELLPLVDAVSISGHKLNGPVGVGALLFRSKIALNPMLFGGGQQLEMRPGTESVVAAVALAAAVEGAEKYRRSGGIQELTQLRDRFEQSLLSRLPWIQVIGQRHQRLPHISSVAFPGCNRQGLLMKFDLAGLECSSGSACASGSSQPSHVLVAMDFPKPWIDGTIRFSFGKTTTLADVDRAVEIIAASFDQ